MRPRDSLGILGFIAGLCLASMAHAQSPTPPRGEALFQVRCAPCHTLYPPPKVAPPMMGVVMHYSDAYRTRDQFVDAVTRWVAAPAKDKSRMPAHAIDKFGVMPFLGYPEAEVKVIAGWIWDTFTGPGQGCPGGPRGGGRCP